MLTSCERRKEGDETVGITKGKSIRRITEGRASCNFSDGTFEVHLDSAIMVAESDIDGSPQIFGSRLVEKLKKVGEKLKKKIMLLAQTHADEVTATIVAEARRYNDSDSAWRFAFKILAPT